MSKRNMRKQIVFVCVILILVLVILYSGLRVLESTVFYRDAGLTEPVVSKTIIREGKSYFPRQDITVIMALGTDTLGPVTDSGSYRNESEADMVALFVFDETNETYSILTLNRDTMLEMPALGLGGKPAGYDYGQLALAHTFGSGLADSCENVRQTLSDFLYGIRIDYYLSLNMDGIALANDAVGGVTVTVTDDFSQVDPSITKGEITLRGEQAKNFVQIRKDVGDQKNLSRMERHREYMEGFAQALGDQLERDGEFGMKLYEAVAEYVVTDCSVNAISSMLQRYSDYSLKQIVTPAGENVLGEEYYEFYVDEEKLDSLILELFFAEKE